MKSRAIWIVGLAWFTVCGAGLGQEDEIRAFTSRDGTKTLEARLVSVQPRTKKMTLGTADGRRLVVDFDSFAEADVAYALKFAKANPGPTDHLPDAFLPNAETYHSGRAAAELLFKESSSEARAAYAAILGEEKKEAMQDGEIALVRVIEDEEKKLGGALYPMEPAFGSALKSARRSYLRALTAATKQRDKQIEKLGKDYLVHLAKIEKDGASPQIESEKAIILGVRRGMITDFRTQLPGTTWRVFEGNWKDHTYKANGIVNSSWRYEILAKDRVRVMTDVANNLIYELDSSGKVMFFKGKPDRYLVEE